MSMPAGRQVFEISPNLAISIAFLNSFAFIKFLFAFDERNFYFNFPIFIIH